MRISSSILCLWALTSTNVDAFVPTNTRSSAVNGVSTKRATAPWATMRSDLYQDTTTTTVEKSKSKPEASSSTVGAVVGGAGASAMALAASGLAEPLLIGSTIEPLMIGGFIAAMLGVGLALFGDDDKSSSSSNSKTKSRDYAQDNMYNNNNNQYKSDNMLRSDSQGTATGKVPFFANEAATTTTSSNTRAPQQQVPMATRAGTTSTQLLRPEIPMRVNERKFDSITGVAKKAYETPKTTVMPRGTAPTYSQPPSTYASSSPRTQPMTTTNSRKSSFGSTRGQPQQQGGEVRPLTPDDTETSISRDVGGGGAIFGVVDSASFATPVMSSSSSPRTPNGRYATPSFKTTTTLQGRPTSTTQDRRLGSSSSSMMQRRSQQSEYNHNQGRMMLMPDQKEVNLGMTFAPTISADMGYYSPSTSSATSNRQQQRQMQLQMQMQNQNGYSSSSAFSTSNRPVRYQLRETLMPDGKQSGITRSIGGGADIPFVVHEDTYSLKIRRDPLRVDIRETR